MPNSIFYRISRFYAHHNIAPLKDINNFFADSFLCQGIAVGKRSDYKIYFCCNKRLACGLDVPVTLLTRMSWIYSALFDSKCVAYF